MTEFPCVHLKRVHETGWELTEDCYVKKLDITIFKSFRTDLVSSGRVLWWFIPPHGQCVNSAIVHDYLCRNKAFTRRKCDDVFLNLLRDTKIKTWQRYLMYYWVRLFGWIKY
jgi:Protein of unknown function (DUF1353)